MRSYDRNRRSDGTRLPVFRIGKCVKCRKLAVFTRKRAALCPVCQFNASYTADMLHVTKNYRAYSYRNKRKKIIAEQKWCQLCGSKKNLTAHHVGGREDLGLVCLCSECHNAYEHWHREKLGLNKKKKIIKT